MYLVPRSVSVSLFSSILNKTLILQEYGSLIHGGKQSLLFFITQHSQVEYANGLKEPVRYQGAPSSTHRSIFCFSTDTLPDLLESTCCISCLEEEIAERQRVVPLEGGGCGDH